MQESTTVYLEEMMQDQQGSATVLAITSGKGGVGKSNIAVNLAICLSAAQKRVVLVDADLALGNVDILMDIKNKYNISHVLSGEKELDEIMHIDPSGVEVICGASGLEAAANLNPFQRNRLINGLESLEKNCDFLIIDTGAGIDHKVVGFCLASDHVLVATTPEPTAITDAYAMIKVLVANEFAGRISLIVNMVNTIDEGKKIYKQIASVAKRFLDADIYMAGVLPRDEKMNLAIRQRKPVVLTYPRSSIASAMVAMTATLKKGSPVSDCREGFFRKVANWFS